MNKERAYDEKINPLMAQIIAICKENKIAMVCTFSIGDEKDPGLLCTSVLTTKEYAPPEEYIEMVKLIYRESPVTMINVTDEGGKIVSSTAILG